MDRPVVLLDRIVEGVLPGYCLHGQTECARCHQWCHLGHETQHVVASGQATPLCIDCMLELRATGQWPNEPPMGRVNDHRRADGPHEPDANYGWTECGNPTCSNRVQISVQPGDQSLVVSACSRECANAIAGARSAVRQEPRP